MIFFLRAFKLRFTKHSICRSNWSMFHTFNGNYIPQQFILWWILNQIEQLGSIPYSDLRIIFAYSLYNEWNYGSRSLHISWMTRACMWSDVYRLVGPCTCTTQTHMNSYRKYVYCDTKDVHFSLYSNKNLAHCVKLASRKHSYWSVALCKRYHMCAYWIKRLLYTPARPSLKIINNRWRCVRTRVHLWLLLNVLASLSSLSNGWRSVALYFIRVYNMNDCRLMLNVNLHASVLSHVLLTYTTHGSYRCYLSLVGQIVIRSVRRHSSVVSNKYIVRSNAIRSMEHI